LFIQQLCGSLDLVGTWLRSEKYKKSIVSGLNFSPTNLTKTLDKATVVPDWNRIRNTRIILDTRCNTETKEFAVRDDLFFFSQVNRDVAV
jgi:hypothetical protein